MLNLKKKNKIQFNVNISCTFDLLKQIYHRTFLIIFMFIFRLYIIPTPELLNIYEQTTKLLFRTKTNKRIRKEGSYTDIRIIHSSLRTNELYNIFFCYLKKFMRHTKKKRKLVLFLSLLCLSRKFKINLKNISWSNIVHNKN